MIGIGLLALPGCLLPYCARSVNELPAFDLNCNPAEVHAFCVDVASRDVRDENSTEHWTMAALTPTSQGRTPVQAKVSYDWGVFAFSPTYTAGPLVATTHTLYLRLYRPGYETVILRPADPPDMVRWVPTKTLADQELALDTLYSFIVPGGRPVDSEKVQHEWELGGTSPAHSQALAFGASEYLRLAAPLSDKNPDQKEVKKTLTTKAKHLQVLAAAGVKRKTH
jgi:hypothetical protein